mmetsp:Transcript_1427/g.2272  ORF Transcript_1427/g.2272 Transcript_1427/m.2272 type:complete len:151 (+) Transcript_1427:62-514(+)
MSLGLAQSALRACGMMLRRPQGILAPAPACGKVARASWRAGPASSAAAPLCGAAAVRGANAQASLGQRVRALQGLGLAPSVWTQPVALASTVSKRFRVRGNGELKYMQGGRSHRMRKHNRNRNRKHGKAKLVTSSHPLYKSLKTMMSLGK